MQVRKWVDVLSTWGYNSAHTPARDLGFPQPWAVLGLDQLKGYRGMKKKAARKRKESAVKSKKNGGLLSSSFNFDSRSRGSRPMKLTEDPRFAQAVQNYEAG